MKKILVPIDGSSVSQKSVEKAVELAKKYGSDITFAHIVKIPESYTYGRNVGHLDIDLNEVGKRLKKSGEEMLESLMENIDCENLVCEKLVVEGQPGAEILKIAEDGDFDLIVMGRRGYSKVKRFFVGSVTQRVISDATCPVLVVNE